MIHLQCKEGCFSPDHAEQLYISQNCISFPLVPLMSTTEVVRASWLRVDKGSCEGWRCSSHKNLCTFYTAWRAAELLPTNSWNGVTNLSAGCSTEERNYCPPPSSGCHRSCTEAKDLWTQGPTFVSWPEWNFSQGEKVRHPEGWKSFCEKSSTLIGFWSKNLMIFFQEDGWLLSRWLSTTSFLLTFLKPDSDISNLITI